MDIVYSKHAVTRMEERGITSSEVELVLDEPDGKIQQSADKWIYFKKLPKRRDNLVAVVLLIKGVRRFEIITVMIHFEVIRENNSST